MKIKSISYLTKIPYLLCFFCVSGRESIDFSPFGVVVVFLTHSVTPSQHFVKLQKTDKSPPHFLYSGWMGTTTTTTTRRTKKKRNSVGWGFSYFISLHIGDGADDGCRGGCGCVCGTGPGGAAAAAAAAAALLRWMRAVKDDPSFPSSTPAHHHHHHHRLSPIQHTFFLI
jgi:hypothetical protein